MCLRGDADVLAFNRGSDPRRTVHLVTLTATIQRKPEKYGADPDPETRRITADGNDYDTAKTALEAQLPDGWRMLWINADR